VELRAFGAEHVVVADVAEGGASLSDQLPLEVHILRTLKLLISDGLGELDIGQLIVRVECDGPITLEYEVNLCDIKLLLVHVAVLVRILELARHKAKGDLKQEVRVELLAHLEEALEGRRRDYVLEEELAHDVLLDFEWDRVEIVSSLLQNCGSIVVPKEPKVRLDTIPQINRNIRGATLRLILNFLNKHEPRLQLILIIIEIGRFHRQNHINEIIHKDREEGHPEDLNERAQDFLADRAGIVVTVAHSGQGRQRIVHARDESLVDLRQPIQILGGVMHRPILPLEQSATHTLKLLLAR